MHLTYIVILSLFSALPRVSAASVSPTFVPCDPESETSWTSSNEDPAPQFCAQWNPDFSFNGHQCCAKMKVSRKRKRVLNSCSPKRTGSGYCSEMTSEQRDYSKAASDGRLGDVLERIKQDIGKKGDQAFCSVNNGFLANGRPIIPSEVNRIIVKSPERCLNFGTDPMVGMLEWLGREMGKEDPFYRLLLGDVSGPRGGCLFGRSGKRGHASHTSGQDADIGFFSSQARSVAQTTFNHHFDAGKNWSYLKKIFHNPFACVKVVFLDRRHIRALSKVAKNDEDWNQFHRFIRHMPGHKNHFHVRVGKGPGEAGCGPGAQPEKELEESSEEFEAELLDEVDELKSRKGFRVQK